SCVEANGGAQRGFGVTSIVHHREYNASCAVRARVRRVEHNRIIEVLQRFAEIAAAGSCDSGLISFLLRGGSSRAVLDAVCTRANADDSAAAGNDSATSAASIAHSRVKSGMADISSSRMRSLHRPGK